MRKYGRRGRDNPATLLVGVALGAMIVYLGSSIIKTMAASKGASMSLASNVCMAGCPGGRPYVVDVTGRPYSVAMAHGVADFPVLPSGMTSITGVYPPVTGPY
jgi:hypothetical protein